MNTPHRSPRVFAVSDPTLRIHETPEEQDQAQLAEARTEPIGPKPRRWRWGAILFGTVGALISLAFGLWLSDLIAALWNRSDWLGWLAAGLTLVACLAIIALITRELTALWRLRHISALRKQAERALSEQDFTAARRVGTHIIALYNGRPHLSLAKAEFHRQAELIYDADAYLELIERRIMSELDAEASAVISRAARQVSLATAISPVALFDLAAVTLINLRMIGYVAVVYGGRPGRLGLLRLARTIMAHLTVTGSLALSDGVVQQIFGHGLTARLSAKLGEGMVNGLFTARVGLMALDLCRPIGFHALKPPSITSIAAAIRDKEPAIAKDKLAE